MLGSLSGIIGLFVAMPLFAVNPSSASYNLKGFEVGGSGGGQESSTSFNLNAETGTLGQPGLNSASYKVNAGQLPTQEANVPPAPVFTNPSSEYRRLRLTVNTDNHPSDTRFLIAISPDSFATTYYVQTDNSIGSSVSLANYQTYTAWGGASGFWITGLTANTTYSVRIKALQGNFSGSAFGPTVTAATVLPTITYSIETTASSTPPFSIGFSSLVAGNVVSSSSDVILRLTSNALYGGGVYVRSQNAGLSSAAAGVAISSATADLSVVSSGYGAQVVSTSQSSGGPITSLAPFSSGSNQVGQLTTGYSQIISTGQAVTTGQANVRLKAKAEAITPSSPDYTDTLTFVAAMQF